MNKQEQNFFKALKEERAKLYKKLKSTSSNLEYMCLYSNYVGFTNTTKILVKQIKNEAERNGKNKAKNK